MSVRAAGASQSPPPWVRAARGAVMLDVLAHPGASRSRIVRIDPRGVVIDVAAPPEKGKANAELIALLARLLGAPRGTIAIVRGGSSRRKVVQIAGTNADAVAARLLAIVTRK
jgi:uncharacterized protein